MTTALRFMFAAPITLSDGTATWQQVLATGAWKHPQYGDMAITAADLRELKQNFDAGARRFVYADYDHGIARADGSGNAIAAGEVKALELRNGDTELWALYEPTDAAREKIARKEYRFTSADFDTRYRDKVSGKLVGKVLKGFALTNTPYIETMHPLTLGDARGETHLFAEFDPPSHPTMPQIAEKLGLKADATDAEIEAKIDTLLSEAQQGRQLSESNTAATATLADVRSALTLADDADGAAVTRAVKTLAEQNATLTKQTREREADQLLDERIRKGHLTPAQRPKMRERLLSDDAAVVAATKEILAEMPKIVPIGETKAAEGTDKDRDTLLDERTAAIQKEKNLSYADALVLAERELSTSTGK